MKGKNQKVRLYGDPVLRKKTKPVKKIDNVIKKLIADLKVTMLTQDGLGLAANQIGASLAVFCFNPRGVHPAPFDKMTEDKIKILKFNSTQLDKRCGVNIEQDPVAVLNPVIIKAEGKEEREEACLSLPGIVEVLLRPQKVVIQGFDENGKEIELTSSGLLARVFQHEIDHLNGIFFIDHLSPTRRRMLKKQLDDFAKRQSLGKKD